MAAPARPPITCHVLDTVIGKPAAGINCTLSIFSSSPPTASTTTSVLASGTTNADGRVTAWDAPLTLTENTAYKIRFETWDYFGGETFFPFVEIVFVVRGTAEHYHVPLLLAPWSYSTYRGS